MSRARSSSYVLPRENLFVIMKFFNELRQVCIPIQTKPHQFNRGDYLSFSCWVVPSGLLRQLVTIKFRKNDLDSPIVTTEISTKSPHRYSNGSLCMWYPYDSDDLRWRWKDGGAALIAHIHAHLIREAWWVETGEWVGDEVEHGLSIELGTQLESEEKK